jgi:hypothetical protein
MFLKMKSLRRHCVLFAILGGLAGTLPITGAAEAGSTSAPGPIETLKIAVDAYVYGYPLVTFDKVRAQNTNVAEPDAEHAPIGQMIKMRSYPAVDNHCCAAPNSDTLYTMVWLDVSEEPWIIKVPAMGDRYYILPFLDGWSEVIHVASQPLTGGGEQTYAVSGPGWSGSLPDGVTEVKSGTGMVWVLGRIYSDGSKADYAEVHALQDAFDVRPLSAWGEEYTPPKGKVDPKIDMKTAVRKQVNGLDTEAFFDRLAELMVANPPHPEDSEMVEQMARIGIQPGQDFDPGKLDFLDRELLGTVPKLARLEMGIHLKRQPTTNGWLYFTKGVGNWGKDYLTRGMANLLGPGWNRPQDAIYPISLKDADGDAYDASKYDYMVRLEKGRMPPADAFWSLTLYDDDLFFVPNPLNRFELSTRNPFVTGEDGAIELYLQAKSPGRAKEPNWLPAPEGKFKLVLRLYDPAKAPPSILDSSWTPPPVKRVE